MSDKDHPTTEYDDYGSENNYDTGYDDGIESDGYTSEDYESGEYESDENETGDYASDDYDAEYSDSDSYASDDYDAEDGDPEYYDSEQYAASDYDDAYDQGEYDVESADPATIDPDTIPPEALEPYYDKSAFKWLKNMNRAKLIRLVSMLIFSVAILVFASIAWFTMSREVETGGMGGTAVESVFELKTSGSAGLYDDLLDSTILGYGDTQETGNTDGIKWKLVSGSSEMKNLYTDSEELTIRRKAEITRSDSEEYGLKPGDSGTLLFSIVPKQIGISVDFRLNLIGYSATFDDDGIYKTDDDLEVIDNTEITHYMSSHILFFYTGTDNNKHLLTANGFRVDNISLETPVSIYWVWVPTLKEILEANISELNDASASEEVKQYFFAHPDYFLKPTGSYNFDPITVNEGDEITSEIMGLVTGRNYNAFAAMYNDADQNIGDHVNYLFVEMLAGVTSE